MSRRFVFLLVPLLGACGPDLGECQQALATRPAYEQATGLPAYEGQALLIQSCGSGAFCHAEPGESVDSFGAPAHLTFDLTLASTDGEVELADANRLRRSQFRTLAQAHAILASLDSGSMPPRGLAGDEVRDSATPYLRVSPETGSLELLPAIESDEGREIVRNYLACGAPVVGQPVAPPDGSPPLVGNVVRQLDIEPVGETWPEIYEDLLVARCNGQACHGGGPDRGAGLNLVGQDIALERLLEGTANATSMSAMCGETGLPLLVPGDPEGSLLFQKLAGTSRCGDPMPLRAAAVDADSLENIRSWILALEPSP